MRRHGVSNLNTLKPDAEQTPKPSKTFKDYQPSFLHIDVKYLPQMPDETQRRYLFAAIDRASRWVYLEVLNDKSARSAQRFLKRLSKACPIKIHKILTDNGKEFTDRFWATGKRKPSGTHLFDTVCDQHGIEHRLITPRHPQTNGMIERFNGRISDILTTTRFDSSQSLEETLIRYVRIYNHSIPQRALGHITPIQAFKNWYKEHPELFSKRVYNQAGLDT